MAAAALGRRWQQLEGGGGVWNNGDDTSGMKARGGDGFGGGRGGSTRSCCGGDGGRGGCWSPSLIFLEQPLEREFTLFFLQMTTRVCGGVPSPLIEPKMGRERKGPT